MIRLLFVGDGERDAATIPRIVEIILSTSVGAEFHSWARLHRSLRGYKRKLLFGLHRARKAKSKILVVMEGYTDVMAAHLAGLESAVATLGTSLTQEHASLLRRFAADGVSLLFDGDSAGLRAAERAYPALATELLSARICLMRDGLDPADLVSQDGRSGLDQVLAEEAKAET